MKKLRLLLFIATLQFFTFNTAYSNHIIGGNFKISQTAANDFDVNLTIYRDCSPGNSTIVSPATICVFDAVTHAQVTSFSMSSNLISQQVLPLGDLCCLFPTLCVEEYVFQTPVTLADNPNGYYFTWYICCRSSVINNFSNPGTSGVTFYTQIPDPALWNTTTVNGTNGNSSPAFSAYPNEAPAMSVGNLNIMDFSATDADGDSLSYSLIDPIDASSCSPQPFPNIVWYTGFSLTNILGNTTSPSMVINPLTGQIICYPEMPGVFSFAVKVEEWRNGIKIGEVVQDIYFYSLMVGGSGNNVDFSASPQSLNTPPFIVQFSNLTPNLSNMNFTWDFGDGTILQDNNSTVTHEYQDTGIYYVSLLASDTCVSTGLCTGETNYKPNYISCTNTTSSISYEISEIGLFPNPSKDVVTLVVEQDLLNSTYVILDQLGKIVGKGNITALSTILDMSGYNKGLYFIQIGQNKEPLKVVIQ